MKKYFNLYFILGLSFFLVFILTIILLNFDKAIIASNGYEVGMSHINNIVNYEYKKWADKISDVLFYMTFIIPLLAVILGIYQLIKEKSLKKVDSIIIIFGVFLVLAIATWLLFDHVIKINIRPINEIEGSFPSTHVFLTTFFVLACHGYLCYKYDNKLAKYLSLVIAIVVIIIMTIFRVVAGVHYLTDVFGGAILGITFYFLTFGIFKWFINKQSE